MSYMITRGPLEETQESELNFYIGYLRVSLTHVLHEF